MENKKKNKKNNSSKSLVFGRWPQTKITFHFGPPILGRKRWVTQHLFSTQRSPQKWFLTGGLCLGGATAEMKPTRVLQQLESQRPLSFLCYHYRLIFGTLSTESSVSLPFFVFCVTFNLNYSSSNGVILKNIIDRLFRPCLVGYQGKCLVVYSPWFICHDKTSMQIQTAFYRLEVRRIK